MGHFLPQEELAVKEIYFLSKLRILFYIWLLKILLIRGKYLSKTTIFPRSEKLYSTMVVPGILALLPPF